MPLRSHCDRKYHSSKPIGSTAEWDALRVEHRQIGSGTQNGLTAECTELVYILSGQARGRRKGDGQMQEGIARPGPRSMPIRACGVHPACAENPVHSRSGGATLWPFWFQ